MILWSDRLIIYLKSQNPKVGETQPNNNLYLLGESQECEAIAL
ncbi:MAG: hypothetical protein WBA93_30590 [Microcoleaceae cyanobacterium]